MPIGAGKYDNLCTDARIEAKSRACILVIPDPKAEHGFGFSCQIPPLLVPTVPGILRWMADEIEKSIPADMKEMLERAKGGDFSDFKIP
jgi:hypothetical protein